MTGLPPDKFKKGLKKVRLGEKASDEILKDLNKITEKKPRPIIKKKYPGADFKPNYPDDDGYCKYEDLVYLYDPPECISIEERINEMEEHLNLLPEEDLQM